MPFRNRITSLSGSWLAVLCAVLTLLATIALWIVAAHAATPEQITMTPADTAATWQSHQIAGALAEDRNNCVEDVTCDTLVLTLAPGDYTGKRLRFSIQWTVPTNDIDVYVFENVMGGEVAGISNGPAPSTTEAGFVAIDLR